MASLQELTVTKHTNVGVLTHHMAVTLKCLDSLDSSVSVYLLLLYT